MSINNACTALAVGFFCLVSLPAQAVIVNYTAFLSPANEVPVVTNAPTATGGGGIIFQYDTTSNLLSWTIAFEGLTGAATGAHFHSAPAGANGPVEINLDTGVNADDASLNATIFSSGIGSVLGTFQGNGVLSAAQKTDFLAGNLYVNIHTATNPAGEIRGQILEAQVVPVPAAVWLFGSGLLGLIGIAKRKKA
jgi:hypothetical protein